MKQRIVLVVVAALVAVTGCLTDFGDDDGGSFLALPCEDPVPFEPPGMGAEYAGYIVRVREGLDVAVEAARIEAQCVIPLDSVYPDSFTIPKVNETQIACLRCDPAVERISPNWIYRPL